MCHGTIVERRCKCHNPNCPASGREPNAEGHSLGLQDAVFSTVFYDFCKDYLRTSRYNYNAVHPNCPFITCEVKPSWAQDLCKTCQNCPQDEEATVAQKANVSTPIGDEAKDKTTVETTCSCSASYLPKRPVLTRGRNVWACPEFEHESSCEVARTLAGC
ncbi:hypothetical protein DL546_004692 [Coniochaeta pulveracea]|uniref:Uncharacterized protein n=1 Tax=Coniochaeta pulveracea TaxID=177199 RepID=A0A420Y5M5_9PEZI|nr:hypothetical protein DL546_004692 [Coniochaeta pulveracea]